MLLCVAVVKSKRGTDQLLFDGYRYYVHRNRAPKKYWRCNKKSTTGCIARLLTVNNTVVKISNLHNH